MYMDNSLKQQKPIESSESVIDVDRITQLEAQVAQTSKLLKDINNELKLLKQTQSSITAKNNKRKTISITSNIMFYSCLVLLIIGAVIFAEYNKADKSILGFNLCEVKTDSMAPVYPVGSLLITCSTEPESIKVGDDITISFESNNGSLGYLTHRVADIEKTKTNEFLFYTHGINPDIPDRTPFSEDALVGKVVFSIPFIGATLSFINSNKIIFIALLFIAFAFSFFLRIRSLPSLSGKTKVNTQKENTKNKGEHIGV